MNYPAFDRNCSDPTNGFTWFIRLRDGHPSPTVFFGGTQDSSGRTWETHEALSCHSEWGICLVRMFNSFYQAPDFPLPWNQPKTVDLSIVNKFLQDVAPSLPDENANLQEWLLWANGQSRTVSVINVTDPMSMPGFEKAFIDAIHRNRDAFRQIIGKDTMTKKEAQRGMGVGRCDECGGSGFWTNPAGGRNARSPCSQGCPPRC